MYLVLIAGGHAAGKRTVAHDLARAVAEESAPGTKYHMSGDTRDLRVEVIDLGEYQLEPYQPAVDFPRLHADLEKAGPNTVVFVHGLYALLDASLTAKARLRVFVDSDADVRLSQWILRDEGRCSLEQILEEYLDHCRFEFTRYVEPTKPNADVFLPQGSEHMTIELLAYDVRQSVHKKLHPASSRSTPMVNLRAEAASNMEDRYYAAN